ncbi:hypothetical protein CE91St46_36750 [Eubacteriales bacterium]|nr:hypothetical protein CE91St46_36750 [Eubacteriales bacterium]GKH65284.1 hypothetical protein CE91St47_37530 [Eubacteriales bacterium]
MDIFDNAVSSLQNAFECRNSKAFCSDAAGASAKPKEAEMSCRPIRRCGEVQAFVGKIGAARDRGAV